MYTIIINNDNTTMIIIPPPAQIADMLALADRTDPAVANATKARGIIYYFGGSTMIAPTIS